MMNGRIDAREVAALANDAKEIVGALAVALHYWRAWRRRRRGRRERAEAEATRREIEDEQTGRFMREAIFNDMELMQQLEIAERDRDQWRRIAEERRQDCERLRAQIHRDEIDRDERERGERREE
ncbi:MAG: hypothetical protein JO250_12370 [Armatimonadetes bacterium]|nr:hypothetical protein [Armatimonadota bacterium]